MTNTSPLSAMRRPSRWTLVFPRRPLSLNDERKKHWSQRAKDATEWRTEAAWLAREQRIPAGGKILITVEVWQSGRLQDVANCYPSVKAAIDGIVDAGVIPDDTPEYLDSITFVAPKRCKPGEDRVHIHVWRPLWPVTISSISPGLEPTT